MASDRLSKSALSFSTNTACAQITSSADDLSPSVQCLHDTVALLKPEGQSAIGHILGAHHKALDLQAQS